jgi:hypothetical protein
MQYAQIDQARANSERVLVLFLKLITNRAIMWKTSTPESKMCTSPFQNIMKFAMIDIFLYLSFFFNSVKRVLIFSIINYSHWVKETHIQGFSSIAPLEMHLEKH